MFAIAIKSALQILPIVRILSLTVGVCESFCVNVFGKVAKILKKSYVESKFPINWHKLHLSTA